MKKTVTGFCFVLMCLIMLVMSASAASVSFYQTNKADVPIWSEASSKSTKVRTIASSGTVLRITGSTKNSAGNLWYKINDGTWVYSGNVTGHGHSYNSGGICTGRGCGYEWPYTVYSASGTFVVTNTSGAKIWSRPYSNNSTHYRTLAYGSTLSINARTTNREGNPWYRLTDGSWVYAGNVKQRLYVYFNANGGSGAPSTQNVLKDTAFTLSAQKPYRSQYFFKGWATSSGGSVVCVPGGSYKLSGSITLYAVWSKCSHSKYEGGYCTNCGYEYPLNITSCSGTFVVTNKDGAKIWSRPYSNRSQNVRKAAYGSVLSVSAKTTNKEKHLWYRLTDGNWVYSENVKQRYTVKYNANGGKSAPSSQYYVKGNSITLSKTKPARVGYVFKGWSTSSGGKASYSPGGTYKFSGNVTLYAVWSKCSHSKYTGGYCTSCGYEYPLNITSYSGTFLVTNKDGAKIWSRPYSNNSKNVKMAAYNSSLSVTAKTVNKDNHLWYRLADGNWVYSENVKPRCTVKYNTNGGSGGPSSQYFAKGNSITLSKAKPTKLNYTFKGWATSSGGKASYSPGGTYKFSGSLTLYAVWSKCTHSKYEGGYCTSCGYEYPLKVTAYKATVKVNNRDGAKIWSRPYSKRSQNLRTETYGKVLNIVAKTTNKDNNVWYKLSDGAWAFSGNVGKKIYVTYNVNGGFWAPSKQEAYSGVNFSLNKTEPTRLGYHFKGWALKSTAASSYKAGASVSFKNSTTLYAVWQKAAYSTLTSVKNSKAIVQVPGYDSGFVPQGMCYVEALGMFAVSGYVDDGLSRIYLIDPKTGTSKCYKLQYDKNGATKNFTGHAGGIASYNDKIWVCSGGDENNGGYIYETTTAELNAASDGKLIFKKRFRTYVKCSALYCDGNKLWVSEFYSSGGKYNVSESHYRGSNHAWTSGYNLPLISYTTESQLAPDIILSVPDKVQGMSITNTGEVVFSTSLGRDYSSYLLVYKSYSKWTKETVSLAGKKIPLYISKSSHRLKKITMPTLMEGIDFYNGKLYVVFESGASKYSDARERIGCIIQTNIKNLI